MSPQISRQHLKTNQARYPVAPSRWESSSPSGLEQDVAGRRMDVRIESTASLGVGASPPNPLYTERRDDMPMDELLRLLSERLQPGGRNDDLPPDYHEGRAMWYSLHSTADTLLQLFQQSCSLSWCCLSFAVLCGLRSIGMIHVWATESRSFHLTAFSM